MNSKNKNNNVLYVLFDKGRTYISNRVAGATLDEISLAAYKEPRGSRQREIAIKRLLHHCKNIEEKRPDLSIEGARQALGGLRDSSDLKIEAIALITKLAPHALKIDEATTFNALESASIHAKESGRNSKATVERLIARLRSRLHNFDV